MNVETLLYQWADHCRQLAQRARDDAERAAAFESADPDKTVRLVRNDVGAVRKDH